MKTVTLLFCLCFINAFAQTKEEQLKALDEKQKKERKDLEIKLNVEQSSKKIYGTIELLQKQTSVYDNNKQHSLIQNNSNAKLPDDKKHKLITINNVTIHIRKNKISQIIIEYEDGRYIEQVEREINSLNDTNIYIALKDGNLIRFADFIAYTPDDERDNVKSTKIELTDPKKKVELLMCEP